jgi:signal transduction histidine kinase/ligand-binding sensor domain-containing protein
MARWLLILYGLIFSFLLSAQSNKVSFQHYTTANGLCDNYAQSVFEDSRGFIWIGTREGLSRFDGAYFKNFFAGPDSTSFPNNIINSITEYKPGHLVFSSSGRIWCMNTLNNTFYQPPAFLRGRYFSSLQKLSDNTLVIASNDTTYLCTNEFGIIKKISSPFPVSQLETRAVYSLPGDRLLYSNMRQHFIYNIHTGGVTPYELETKFIERESLNAFKLFDEKTSTLFFDNYWQGLYQYDMKGKELDHYAAHPVTKRSISANSILSILAFNDSIIFLGTSLGLNALNKNTGLVQKYMLPAYNNLAVQPAVLNMFKDNAGNLWVASTAGLSKLTGAATRTTVINSTAARTFSGDCYYIAPGEEPYLYAGFLGLGTVRINKTNNTATRIDSTYIIFPWYGMYKDSIFYVCGGGTRKIAAWNTVTNRLSAPAFLDPFYGIADLVTLMFTDSYGDEWYSINQGGGLVRKAAGSNAYEHYSRRKDPNVFTPGYLATAAEDKKGNLWFGVNKSSLLLHWDRASGRFNEVLMDTVPGARGKVFNGVFSVYSGKADTLWISYQGSGLVAYDISKNNAKVFTLLDGLPTQYINAMVADHKNRLWIAAERGLVCYLPEEGRFVTFKKENGLPSDEFKSGAIYFDQKTHDIWIPSGSEIIRFQPDDLLSQVRKNIRVYIDEIRLNGSPFDPVSATDFRYTQNNLQFQFTAVEIENGKDLEFAYQLEGADPGWVMSGDKRSASYSSLNPGKYTFKVRARLKGDTEWTDAKQSFIFSVATPWWKTWWFRVILLAAFAGIVLLVARNYYLRRLEKERTVLEKQQAIEKERTRIATDMHDDFGASLSRIKFLSEKLQLQKKDETSTNDDLGKISAYSDEMAEKMGEIVWALNQRYDSSGDLASFCRSYASEYLADKNIRLNFIAEQPEDIKINGEIRRNIFLVMKEALHNIVKHSAATEVEITMNWNTSLNMIIRDNGKGFDAGGVRPFANGLENMKKRMEEIGGLVTIEREKGTIVTLSVNPGIRQNTYM